VELSDLVACTLADTEHKTQKERWLALGASFGLGGSETKDGIRLRFRYHPAVEQKLRALVAVENKCCSWAAWDVGRNDEVLVMAARSSGAGIATLHTMLAQLT
jgi:hypothetical protein